EKLQQQIFWGLPPGSHKDVRQWLVSKNLDPTCNHAWRDAGLGLVREMLKELHEITPQRNGKPLGTEGIADDRPEVVVTPDEHLVNDKAVAGLARDQLLFQRGGLLVRIVRDNTEAAKVIRRPFAPRIEPLPTALLRERLAANLRWLVWRKS